ncbi:beta transducin-like protein HET-D2Y [Zopfia rhizophila CBS 207.26]|uniref:Beta transducin-like protein HET-D2Y n=1 Tax=Zopfia rhizophila CBS 207.26 TaxID=1314779 RepID=A0A6A6D6M4_9PEZI|nr:beta transducin-like protein HET-D2Y [Zopfia rhizophila CBS 207.26]
MRLLRRGDTGEFSFTEDLVGDEAIPPYAILSHTWGVDTEEVTFDDLINGTGKDKPGYKKIRFCGEQARQDGLQYFWIDTCCINKANKAELSHAISSMFRWYRNATRCYVYLPDVSSPPFDTNEEFNPPPWESDFRKSRLLAPSSVEFFSQEGKRLGDKNSLRQQIHEITAIPNSGEEIGKLEKCMQDLHLTDPRDDKKRIEETKGGLLEDSYHWILENSDFQRWRDDQQSRLLWIKGDPGKGKTMLLCGIVNELTKSMAKTNLLSYFFCQATDSRINNATAVLRGLLYMLVNQQPSLVSHIRKKYDHAGKALLEDTNAWVALSETFVNILQDPSLNSTYLIVDALDECVTDLPKLLDFVVQKSSVSSRVKWIVSSRNWPNVEEWLEGAGHKVRLCLELNADSVSTAVSIYIQHKAFQLAQRKKYDKKTRDAVLGHLSLNANDTFLWVALVCQDLENIPRWNTLAKLNAFPPGLDSLYERMMQQICNSDNAGLCKQILASISTAYRPITLKELTCLVEVLEDIADDLELIREIVSLLSLQVMSKTLRRDMYSLRALGYPAEQVELPDPDPLAPVTSSATSSADLQDGGAVHEFVRKKYLYSLEALSLCKNMSKGVVSIAKLETLINGRANAAKLVELVRDARRFIMAHKGAIENSPLQAYASALLFSPTHSLIRGLFKEEEPKWITIKPAMGDKWSACLQTLEGHRGLVLSVAFSHDSTRLASASDDKTVKIWDASSGECLQTLEGHRGWVWSVTFSRDSTRLASVSDDKTVMIWDASSGECLQTLEGHRRRVRSVAFSHDSTRLASASDDKTVKIWDASSGECLQTLKGHRGSVLSVAFSHDSIRLASASDDKTVKIWDASSGEYLQTLEGHRGWVRSVAFSHDSTRLASASIDRKVKIWDASSGECLHTLKGHRGSVWSVAFSHDSTRLASASDDRKVKIWDANSDECLQTLEGHRGRVLSVAFSHDSTRLASASDDWTVKIWDASSGECLRALEGHRSRVRSVAFSHDSTRLASASDDKTVKIWDASSGECLQTLEGHRGSVLSVAFSHDSTRLASVSDDKTVKIWDASSGECLQTLKGHRGLVRSVAFSHDSTRLASASNDKTVKIWDASSGECLQTLEVHSGWVRSVAFSHDSTRLASASDDKTVKIWDASSGECLQTLEGHRGRVQSVAFSHDSTRLASASLDRKVKIWDVSSGECLQTLNTGKVLFNISFETTGSYLHTEIGAIVISASSVSNITTTVTEPQHPRYKRGALSSDGAWITYDSENLVWLPSEYRPSCSAVSGKTIGIGVGSGKVWVCDLELDKS